MNQSYLRRQRHVLLDMHVPGSDPGFLARFDPAAHVRSCVAAGADAVMIYCNSHVGLCYWPTVTGRAHPALAGRDAVGEQLAALHEAGLAVCAYYSGPLFDNQAYLEHPDWRIVPARAGRVAAYPARFAAAGSRFGLCCPNNPDALAFVLGQVEELASGYPFDAFFFDMVFWPGVCVCAACRQRYRSETGSRLPEAVDWFSPSWCRFQSARQRWLADAFRLLRERVRADLDIPVFVNGIAMEFDWSGGGGPELAELNDLLGGDFHGHGMLANLAARTPTVMQYMKAVSAYTGGASRLMALDEQLAHAMAATAFGGQFMAIDAVSPDGTVNEATFGHLTRVFDTMKPFAPYLGRSPVADIAVYWSQQAAVDFRDNGVPLDEIGAEARTVPHAAAMDGAFTALRQAHLPVTVISRDSLADLDTYQVVVLPNVLRMDAGEVAALRGYVERGGSVYASGHTSLVTTDGTRHGDFLLADVFGAHAVAGETFALTYLRPATAEVASWVAPVRYATHGRSSVHDPAFGTAVPGMRVRAAAGAQVLATVTLPYGSGLGSRDDDGWANIHSSPPWQDTGRPAVTRHRYGAGTAVYSAPDIESDADPRSPASRSLFVGIVRSLLRERPVFQADAHPQVWITAFHDAPERRIRVSLLNHPDSFPALPVPDVRLRLSPRPGTRFTGLHRLPAGEPVRHEIDDDGVLHAELPLLRTFAMLAAPYEDAPT